MKSKNLPLADCLLQHLSQWEPYLSQERTLDRVAALGVGLLCGVGQRTITRAIGFHDNTQKDWSADYKMFSRSPWEPRDLFAPILQEAIQQHQLERLVVSVDDTRVWRTGRHVPMTQWHRDPMGPAFHTNLRWGHRFLQAITRRRRRKTSPGSLWPWCKNCDDISTRPGMSKSN